MSPQEIKEHILSFTPISPLDSGVDTLLAGCPGPEEFTAVEGAWAGEKNIEKYAKPEQFVLGMREIPKMKERLETWKYMMEFDSVLEDIKPCFLIHNRFFEYVNESAKF